MQDAGGEHSPSAADAARVTVDARPTKNFFVEMLVRDVDLLDAVVDLVDNSVDGARRLRGREGDYRGLHVAIAFDGESFRITDNCGGMSLASPSRVTTPSASAGRTTMLGGRAQSAASANSA
jgi:hypothetical protein